MKTLRTHLSIGCHLGLVTYCSQLLESSFPPKVALEVSFLYPLLDTTHPLEKGYIAIL